MARIDRARRHAAALGVESARCYQQQKHTQSQLVSEDLERRRQSIISSNLMVHEAAIAQAAQQSDGMRNAEQFVSKMAMRAHKEISAWEAERVLERERYSLALRQQRLLAEKESNANLQLLARKKSLKELERIRSQKAVELSRSHSSGVPLTESNATDGGHFSTLHSADGVSQVWRLAEEVDRSRQQQISDMKAKVEKERRNAATRSAQIVAQQKQLAARQKIESEEEAALRQGMVDNAMRSVRPIAATDFPEQVARVVQKKMRQAVEDFEKTFLSGPWTAGHVIKHHCHPQVVGTDVDEQLEESSPSQLLNSTSVSSGLRCTRLATVSSILPHDEDDTPTTVDFNDPEPAPAPTETPLEKQPVDHVEQAAGEQGRSLQWDRPVVELEEVHSTLGDIQPPSSDAPAEEANDSQASTQSVDPIKLKNRQFLQELADLQHRLAKAGQRLKHDAGDSSDDNKSGDVSVSTMSSPEKESSKNRVTMSSDQLREALRRMKFVTPL